jgi:hypothetical protein
MKISIILPTYRKNCKEELDNLHNYQKYIDTSKLGEEFDKLYDKYVKNCNHILEPTLNCILNQTFPIEDYEIILCHKYPEDISEIYKLFTNLKLVKEKPSIWHELGNYATVNNNRNTGIINATGELLFFLDDLTIFNENLLQEVWDNYQDGFYTTCKVIKRIKIENEKLIGTFKVKGLAGQGLLNNSATWTYGMSVSLKETLKINGFDEIWDGSFGGTDHDFGRRLDSISRYKRKIGPLIYEFTHYNEQKKRPKTRDDEIFRAICRQSPTPRMVRANSWKPNSVEMERYETWHKSNIGELDKNWNKFLDVPLYNIQDLKK